MNRTAVEDKVYESDWDIIRVALECLDVDEMAVSRLPGDREFATGVERLYEKLQRMGLI